MMLNLTLSERNYLVELIRKDQNDKETDKPVNLCPDCSVYCVKRFIDGRCE